MLMHVRFTVCFYAIEISFTKFNLIKSRAPKRLAAFSAHFLNCTTYILCALWQSISAAIEIYFPATYPQPVTLHVFLCAFKSIFHK